MEIKEILELYKRRWNEVNVANNHGNISIQRSHTQLLSLTAQTIEMLCERIIEIESTDAFKNAKAIEFDSLSEVNKILAMSGIKNE